MRKGLLATKIGMTQIFTEEGVVIPVTVMKVNKNTVVSKKTQERDGYSALQVGYGDIREKVMNKPRLGMFKKAGVEPTRFLREFRTDAETANNTEVGAVIGLEVFEGVTSVDVFGTSKGKGFAGVMKRHNFGGFRATHGTHEVFRHGGSIGMCSKPGKVFKGQKMAGQMGNVRASVLNLRLAGQDAEQGLLFIRGAVPGPKNGVVEVCVSARTANSFAGVSGEVAEIASKNPMKASKAGGGSKKK